MDELLRQLIDDLGVSRSQFAKNINMDRSQVVKTVNGALPVSKRFYIAIMGAPFIGDDFKERFSAEYNKGATVDNNGKIIEKFFSGLTAPSVRSLGFSEEGDSLGAEVFAGARRAFEQGRTVYAVCAHEHKAVNMALLRALGETGSMGLKRICAIPRSLSDESMAELFDLAEFACLGVQTYSTEERFGGLLPFGVLSDDFAVAFDSDGHFAVSTDGETCASLARKYERMTSGMRGVIVFFEDEAQTLMRRDDLNYGSGSTSIYNIFSPIGLVDAEMLRTVAHPSLPSEVRDNLIRATIAEYDLAAKERDGSYYTSEAIETFARTGRIAAITQRYIGAFPVADRIVLLRRLCELIKNDRASIIKTGPLRFFGDICINNNGIDLCICGHSLRSDLYCAHVYLNNGRIPGTEGLARTLRTQLPMRSDVMSKIGAEYYIEALIASMG